MVIVYGKIKILMTFLMMIAFIYNSNIIKLKIIENMKGKKLNIKFYEYFNPNLINNIANQK